jgi:hypothetical protein
LKAEQRLGKKWMGQAPISFSMEKGNDFHADVQVSGTMHWVIWVMRTTPSGMTLKFVSG